jgi:hypothetical protein
VRRFTRRQFIQAGLGGSALLVTVGCARGEPHVGVVHALIPVVLAGALPAEGAARDAAIKETHEAFQRAVSGLAPAVQEEIGQLLSLLAFAPTRLLVAGVASPWSEASAQEIGAFLHRWRDSRFELKRSGSRALTQLIQGAWYDNPLAWTVIGYPGPPALEAPRT